MSSYLKGKVKAIQWVETNSLYLVLQPRLIHFAIFPPTSGEKRKRKNRFWPFSNCSIKNRLTWTNHHNILYLFANLFYVLIMRVNVWGLLTISLSFTRFIDCQFSNLILCRPILQLIFEKLRGISWILSFIGTKKFHNLPWKLGLAVILISFWKNKVCQQTLSWHINSPLVRYRYS